MKKYLVCKMVVPFGQGVKRYYLFFPTTGCRPFGSLSEVADFLREVHEDEPFVRVKNEAPFDVLLVRDDTLPDRVIELERLSRDEARELIRLLKK